MGLFYGNVALGGGGLILVDALPTANATEYNKHNLYLYNGEIYYITEDSGTYAYEKLPNKAPAPSGYSGNIIASWNGAMTGNGDTYFKFDSDTCDSNNYDGYVDRYGHLTGASSFSNISKIAIYNNLNDSLGAMASIDGINYFANGSTQVVNLTTDGNIYIYGLRFSSGG